MMKTFYTGMSQSSDARWRVISISFLLKLFVTAAVILACNARMNAQPLSVTQNANSQTLAQLLAGKK